MSFNYIYQIENHCFFAEDYDLIVHCVESLHKCMFKIHENIYIFPFLFFQSKKKFIQTMLYDITRRCELVMFSTVGYEGLQEKEARLLKLKKYFYTSESEKNNCSVVRLLLSLLQNLFNGDSIYSVLSKTNMLPYIVTDIKNLIDINSFKSEKERNKKNNNINFLIKEDGLTYNEFLRIVKSKGI